MIATSEADESKAGASNGIGSVTGNAPDAEIGDQSGKSPAGSARGWIGGARLARVHHLRMRVTWIGAICSLVLASAAGLGLALWPCAYQGVEAAGGAPERQLCESLVQANGMSVLGVLVLPVLLAGLGLVAVRGRHRGVLVVVMVALVTFCVLGAASVGLFYLPAAVALVIAVMGWRQVPSPPPAANDPSAGEGRGDLQGRG